VAAAVEAARAAGALGDLRAWLAAARQLEPALEAAVAAAVEADLVAARRADPSLRPEQLHTLLLVQRLPLAPRAARPAAVPLSCDAFRRCAPSSCTPCSWCGAPAACARLRPSRRRASVW